MNGRKKNNLKYILAGILILFLIILSAGSWIYFKGYKDSVKEKNINYLTSLASAKGRTLSAWFTKQENLIKDHFRQNPFYEKRKRKRDKPDFRILDERLGGSAAYLDVTSIALYNKSGKFSVKAGNDINVFPNELSTLKAKEKQEKFFTIRQSENKIFAEAVIQLPAVKEDIFETGYAVVRIDLDGTILPGLKKLPQYFKSEEMFLYSPGSGDNEWLLDLAGNKFYGTEFLSANKNKAGSLFNSFREGISTGIDQRNVLTVSSLVKTGGTGLCVICKANAADIEEEIKSEGTKIIIFLVVVLLVFIFLITLLFAGRKKQMSVEDMEEPVTPEMNRKLMGKTEEFDASSLQTEIEKLSYETEETKVKDAEPEINEPAVDIDAIKSPEMPDEKENAVEEPALKIDSVPELEETEFQAAGSEMEIYQMMVEESQPSVVADETAESGKQGETIVNETDQPAALAEVEAELPIMESVTEDYKEMPEQKAEETVIEAKPVLPAAIENNEMPVLEIEVLPEETTPEPETVELVEEIHPAGEIPEEPVAETDLEMPAAEEIIETPEAEIEIMPEVITTEIETIAETVQTVIEDVPAEIEAGEKTIEEEIILEPETALIPEEPEMELVEGKITEIQQAFKVTEYQKPKKEILNKLDGIKGFGLIPKILYEINLLIKKEPDNPGKLADLIIKEQSLTTKLLAVANSPYYGLKKKITSVEYTVMLLGTEEVCRLITALSLSDAVRFPSTQHLRYLDYWYHSMGVGFTARDLAQKMGFNEIVNDVFLGGVFHDLGVQIIAKHFPKEFEAICIKIHDGENFLKAEFDLLGTTHQEIGRYSAEKWGLPDTIYDALTCHHQPQKSECGKIMAGIINIADWMTHQITKKQSFWDTDIELEEKNFKLLGFRSIGLRNEFFEKYYPSLHATLDSIQF